MQRDEKDRPEMQPGPAALPPRVRLVAVDLDGVVWLGGAILPDAVAALNEVVARGLDLRYVTNNSTAHREAVSSRLAAAGLPAGTDRVLTSGYVTAQWLRQRLPDGARVLVVGEEGLLRELTEAGLAAIHVTAVTSGEGVAAGAGARPDPPAPAAASAVLDQARSSPHQFQAVVVGMDRRFDFAALAAAQAAILAGALFVGTNPDPTFPTPAGLLPGAGSVVAAVATAAQKDPVFMGKPGLGLAEVLESVTGVPPAQTLFIGDRLSTDIGMGRKAGMITALVLTGVTTSADLASERARGGQDVPHHVLSTLADLPPLLDLLAT